MNMEGLSEETLKKFLEKGFINQYPDLFRLEEHKDAILEMDGFGEKSYTNLIASVEKAKDVYLANFIYALGINHVGLRNAKLLCKAFDNDLEKIKAAETEELAAIEGFGEIIAPVSYTHLDVYKRQIFWDIREILVIRWIMSCWWKKPKKQAQFWKSITLRSFLVVFGMAARKT